MFFNKKLLQGVIDNADSYGVREAVGRFLDELRLTSVTKTGELPGEGPLLIISNHPGVFDSLLLLHQIEREDLSFLALATYGIFGPHVREKLLPIYRQRQMNHKIYEYPLCLQVSGQIPENLSVTEIRTRNQKTISQAAHLINSGQAVTIFPTGAVGKRLQGSEWKAGVGFLVKQITSPKTNVVFARIEGTRKSDLVAYLHPVMSRLLYRPRPVSVHFSPSFRLDSLVDQSSDAKTITRQLEKLYGKNNSQRHI